MNKAFGNHAAPLHWLWLIGSMLLAVAAGSVSPVAGRLGAPPPSLFERLWPALFPMTWLGVWLLWSARDSALAAESLERRADPFLVDSVRYKLMESYDAFTLEQVLLFAGVAMVAGLIIRRELARQRAVDNTIGSDRQH